MIHKLLLPGTEWRAYLSCFSVRYTFTGSELSSSLPSFRSSSADSRPLWSCCSFHSLTRLFIIPSCSTGRECLPSVRPDLLEQRPTGRRAECHCSRPRYSSSESHAPTALERLHTPVWGQFAAPLTRVCWVLLTQFSWISLSHFISIS